MPQFIKITTKQCNSQGTILQNTRDTDLYINIDTIAAIMAPDIYLKIGTILKLKDNYFTEFKLHKDEKFPI